MPDNTVLLVNNENDFQNILNRVNAIGENYGLKINVNETKFPIVNKQNANNVRITFRMKV